MKKFNLIDDLYIHPTPGGAFYAITEPEIDPSRKLIHSLLQQKSTAPLTLEGLKQWVGMDDDDGAMGLLHHIQNLGWVQGLESPLQSNDAPLEELLPDMLKVLSDSGKVLLADSMGFYLASSGFPHEVAEELSALSAELANLHERRSGLLINNLGLSGSTWAIVDAVGHSKVGFWPLYIGGQRFVLVISGVPHLNSPNFVELVWALFLRYTASIQQDGKQVA